MLTYVGIYGEGEGGGGGGGDEEDRGGDGDEVRVMEGRTLYL